MIFSLLLSVFILFIALLKKYTNSIFLNSVFTIFVLGLIVFITKPFITSDYSIPKEFNIFNKIFNSISGSFSSKT